MKHSTRPIILLAALLLSSCGQNSSQKNRGFDHLKDVPPSGRGVLLAPAQLDPKSHLLEYKGRAPDPKDNKYLTFETSESQEGRQIRISANELVLEPGHEQGVWELLHENEGFHTVVIKAHRVELKGKLRLPVENVVIRANQLEAGASGKIDIRPLPQIRAQQGADGQQPYRPNLTFAVHQLETAFNEQIIIDASGGRGQKAGAGIPGKAGRIVPALSGQIVQKCKKVCIQSSRNTPGGNSVFSFNGAQPTSVCLDSRWQCKVKDFKWPTHGQDAIAPGKPGPGGDAALIKVSSQHLKKYIKAVGGRAGEEARMVKGGSPGRPNPAIQIKSHKQTVKNFKKGANGYPPRVDLESMRGKKGEFLKISLEQNLMAMNQVFKLRLDYLKDLYIKGHSDKTFKKLKELVKLIQKSPKDSTLFAKYGAKANLLLTKLYQGRDYFGAKRASAPVHSLEATGLNFKSEMRRALKFSAFSQWLETQQVSQKVLKKELIQQQEVLFEEKQTQIKKHAKASQKLGELQQINSHLERQYQVVKEKYQEQKDKIAQQVLENLSVKKYNKLKKALKSAATLASVIPIGQPAAGLIAQSIEALISLQDAQGNFNFEALPEVFETTTRDYKLEETVSNWNQLVSRYRLSELQRLDSKELKIRLKEIGEMAKPVYQVLNQQRQNWARPKLAYNAYKKEMNRLKDISPGFKELAAEIEQLSRIRTGYQKKLSQTLETISESQSKLSQIVNDIALLSPQIALVNEQLNPEVLKSAKRREKLYQEELLSYQAKLARAYQYKNLEAYPYDLNLKKTQNFLMKLMKSKQEASLSESELERIELVYIQQLSSIYKSIIDASSQKGPRREKRVILRLTADERYTLSKNQTVYVDLNSRGLYAENEEEILIENIKVNRVSIHSQESFDLKIEHEGQGLVEKNGEDFYFNYKNQAGHPLFKWGHHFDPKNQHNSDHKPLIQRERNLFLSFMATTAAPHMAQDLEIYTRPAGKASLKLELQGNKKIEVDRLELEIAYSFYEKD